MFTYIPIVYKCRFDKHNSPPLTVPCHPKTTSIPIDIPLKQSGTGTKETKTNVHHNKYQQQQKSQDPYES